MPAETTMELPLAAWFDRMKAVNAKRHVEAIMSKARAQGLTVKVEAYPEMKVLITGETELVKDFAGAVEKLYTQQGALPCR